MRASNLISTLAAGILAVASLAPGAVAPAAAQTAPPTRIRGAIETVSAHAMSVKTRDGNTVEVTLNEPLTVLTVKKLELSAISSGSYVGIATRTGAGGVMQAIEVLVFPEAMRGAGEGSFPWDLEPASTMTNGSVNGVIESKSALQLTVAYKDGSKTIEVAPNAPVVTFAPAERADLKPGAPVFLSAAKSPDGTYSAGRVVVGKDGVAPPM